MYTTLIDKNELYEISRITRQRVFVCLGWELRVSCHSKRNEFHMMKLSIPSVYAVSSRKCSLKFSGTTD